MGAVSGTMHDGADEGGDEEWVRFEVNAGCVAPCLCRSAFGSIHVVVVVVVVVVAFFDNR